MIRSPYLEYLYIDNTNCQRKANVLVQILHANVNVHFSQDVRVVCLYATSILPHNVDRIQKNNVAKV